MANWLSSHGKNNLLTPALFQSFANGIFQKVLRLSVQNSQSNSQHGKPILIYLFGENSANFRYFKI